MNRELSQLIRGPYVRFQTKTLTREGYIINENAAELLVWSRGKAVKIRRDQILFRE